MQRGGEERVTDMEGVEVENGSASARPEADAATAAKEAAKQVVAAMSRRVRGIDKATGTGGDERRSPRLAEAHVAAA